MLLNRYAVTLAGGLRASGVQESGPRLANGLEVLGDVTVGGFGLPFPTAAPHGTAYSSRVVSACSNEIIINQTFNSELQLQFGYTLDENSQHIAFTLIN